MRRETESELFSHPPPKKGKTVNPSRSQRWRGEAGDRGLVL